MAGALGTEWGSFICFIHLSIQSQVQSHLTY